MNEKVLQLIGSAENYYPHALEKQFPQMLKKIVELWNSPGLDPYLQQLMLDTRDHQRQGFPAEVATDIMRLGRINSEQRERAIKNFGK
jgi:hypothetical protein